MIDNYVTGSTIKKLREGKGITQAELAKEIDVSPKTVSKWETAKGLPDISLLEPLASALSVSVAELLSGKAIRNNNVSANMLKTDFYVCPLCGNILTAVGECAVSCCGVSLHPVEKEEADENHSFRIERIEDEIYVSINHPMSKSHYISFLAYVTSDRLQIVKFYPEGNAECRFKPCGSGYLYMYCNHHGLIKQKF